MHGSPKVKEHLGPALLHTYVAVDTAEGVDVDKEDFEKYGARYGRPPATHTHMCRSSPVHMSPTSVTYSNGSVGSVCLAVRVCGLGRSVCGGGRLVGVYVSMYVRT